MNIYLFLRLWSHILITLMKIDLTAWRDIPFVTLQLNTVGVLYGGGGGGCSTLLQSYPTAYAIIIPLGWKDTLVSETGC